GGDGRTGEPASLAVGLDGRDEPRRRCARRPRWRGNRRPRLDPETRQRRIADAPSTLCTQTLVVTSSGSRSDGGLDAMEWLSPLTESERATPVEAPNDGEPEIAPLLAALIPALVSAAPAIISAVSSAFQSKPAPAPASRPATAQPAAS